MRTQRFEIDVLPLEYARPNGSVTIIVLPLQLCTHSAKLVFVGSMAVHGLAI